MRITPKTARSVPQLKEKHALFVYIKAFESLKIPNTTNACMDILRILKKE
jgi:hypothetical protein